MEDDNLKAALNDHEKHYRHACWFALNETKRRGRFYKCEPWIVLKQIFGHGSGYSMAIWNKYKPED